MKQVILVIITCMSISSILYSQSTPIDQNTYTVQSFSTDNTSHPVDHAFDNDTTSWWALYNSEGYSLPGIVEIDLGSTYDINGFSYLPNTASPSAKAIGYEFYISDDGINWGNPQVVGNFPWLTADDLTRKNIHFGAITGRYIKLIYTSNNTTANDNVHTNDLIILESTSAATGQLNQIIDFPLIPEQLSTADPITLNASSNSGLSVSYSVISGPATISGDLLSLTGNAGTVVVNAEQAGDATYYSASTIQSFNVVDLSVIYPIVTTRLSDAFPIEMPELNAYPLYANATIDEADQLSITSIEFEVGANTLPTTLINGYYMAWWTPEAYGNYDINIRSTASNGNETIEIVNVDVVNTASTQNIQTFNGDLINFDGSGASRWFYGNYTLPQSVGAYDQIIANFEVTCPSISGGCDDWDRLGYVEYKAPDGTWMELFRYLTPYGVACDHSIDVTDYASLLQGNIELRMFIDTWGSGGWDLHLDFDYTAGTPEYLYSQVQEVWHGDYNFGNPANLQPCDTVLIDFPENTQKATFRLTTSGHGWGSNNTSNAAEFYYATHNFLINNVPTYSQYLFTDCNPNPDNCTNQAGTWYYDRAGWCPGTIAAPYTYDLTPQISNAPFDFSYIFQESYQDFCHPNNPACVTGVTCDDCNAGYNPFYRIGAYMISFSNTAMVTGVKGIKEGDMFGIDAYPNPSNGLFKIDISDEIGDFVVTINDISGATLKTYFFDNKFELDAHLFDISSLSKGTYFIKVKTEYQSSVERILVN